MPAAETRITLDYSDQIADRFGKTVPARVFREYARQRFYVRPFSVAIRERSANLLRDTNFHLRTQMPHNKPMQRSGYRRCMGSGAKLPPLVDG
jgi:hypothetical protein